VRTVFVGLLLLLWPSLSLAQTRDASPADVLFERGLAAFESGRIDEACANFEDSLRLDAAAGTLINLARCHERQGKTATALAEYKQVVSLSVRAGNHERARVAQAEADRLEPVVAAAATSAAPRRASAAETEVASTSVMAPPPPKDGGARPVLITGVVLGAVGVASLVSGAVLGAISLGDLATAEDDPNLCPDHTCSPAGRAWVDAAETRGNAATGLLVLGGALAATGVVMVTFDLTSKHDDDPAPQLALTPAIGPGDAGVHATLSW
jgi:tetratricopeptide (TPR) repeat protein